MSSHSKSMEALLQKNWSIVPDPNGSAIRLEKAYDELIDFDSLVKRFAEHAPNPALLAFTHLPYIARLLYRDERRLKRILSSDSLNAFKNQKDMLQEISALKSRDMDESSLKTLLRRYRADELSRLALKEFSLGKAIEVGEELTCLASVCLDTAIDYYIDYFTKEFGPPLDKNSLPVTLVVFGMGKLGGKELNFSSDIDLIYMYSTDDGAAGDISLHEFFSKICKKVTTALHEQTEDDHVFRVDLRLRPEGSQGVIANSFSSMERYYETFGRPWERQAWLKCYPVAGDINLGLEMLQTLTPFIYSRSISSDVIDDVKGLTQEIKSQSQSKKLDDGFDVKNGKGGIREVEFFVQSLQLIHSGHYKNTRAKSTRNALQQLFSVGLINDTERTSLLEGYNFLRKTEHLLQLESGRQTQRLPKDDNKLNDLSLRLGFDGKASFELCLQEHCQNIAALFKTLGVEDSVIPVDVQRLLGHDVDSKEAEAMFKRRQFREPARAALEWARLKSVPGCPMGPAASSKNRKLAQRFLEALMTAPDQDAALSNAVDLMARSKSWHSVWRLIDDHPAVLQLVATVFGTSQFLSKILVSNPEQFNALIIAGKKGPLVSQERLARAFQFRLLDVDMQEEEALWNSLAAFKNNQLMRIGLSDIGGMLSVEDISSELTKVAELVVQQALSWSRQSLVKRYGEPQSTTGESCRFAVMAMGKCGGKELSYASDLDLVFVYSGEGDTDGAKSISSPFFMTKLAQRLMRQLSTLHVSGRLYEIDTRLRPSGSKGMLVSSLGHWKRYHQHSARTWERQSITKLRCIAGDKQLGEQCVSTAKSTAFNHGLSSKELANDIKVMREALENDKKQNVRNFKVGVGGIVDIEFISQYVQLKFGNQHTELHTPNTLAALRASSKLGLLDQADVDHLVAGYVFLRSIEMRTRLLDDRSHQVLPEQKSELLMLVKKFGYEDIASFDAEFKRNTEKIRRLFKKIV